MQAFLGTVAQFALGNGVALSVSAAAIAAATGMAMQYRRLYQKTHEERKNFAELIENLSEGVYRSSLDGRQLSANLALVRLNGYDNEAEMLDAVENIAVEWYVDPTRRDKFREILHRQGHVENFVSEIYRHKTRERIWITESARIVQHPKTGKPLYYEGSVREITETVERLQLEHQFRKLTERLPGALFQLAWTDDGLALPYISEGFERLTGMSVERHKAERELFNRFVHPEDRTGYLDAFRVSHDRLEPLDHEFRITGMDGVERWIRINAKPERIEGIVTWYGYAMDVTARRLQSIEIEKLAYFDPLTKLPNRRLLLDRIGAAVTNCGRRKGCSALFFIDLDNFKTLNDTQGHDIGDEYLVEVASRLKGCVRDGDTVARMGGDEFVVILENLGPDEAAASARAIVAANQMLATLRLPFDLGECRHISSASIGVVVFDGSERRVDELLKRADIAMYQAKGAGRDAMALFDPSWMDGETERFTLLGELRRAIADETIALHYQPQVDRMGRIVGAEALLRWRHPTMGDVPPDRFIPVAEQSGMLNALCRYVLREGVATLKRWQSRAATAKLRLAVNVSVQSFSGSDFATYVREIIDEAGIDATRLTIEFTEHVMARDQKLVARRMRELKQYGIRFSLDDFGTGYSSLERLKSLPFDEVKIDGSFVSDIENSENDRALVRTILAMAATLGLECVAEHVETENQQAFLHAFGCDYFQGWLYSPALPRDDFERRVGVTPETGKADNVVRLTA